MGKHSTDETPEQEPVELPEGLTEHEFELHLKGLPAGVGFECLLGTTPFVLISTHLADTDNKLIHVSVIAGGGVVQDETGYSIAQYMLEAAEMVARSARDTAQAKESERSADSDEWTKLLSESAAHFAAADSADEKVLDPKASAHLPDLSGAVDYSAGKAFASERVSDAPLTDRDREDLALLGWKERNNVGADSPIEPAIEEIIEATIEPDEED